MKRLSLVLAFLLAACVAPPRGEVFSGTPLPPTGVLKNAAVRSSPAKVLCGNVGAAVYDPIGNAMHLHEFFGNKTLLGGTGTSCGEPSDTAGYWAPALVYTATGERVPLKRMFAYYRAFNHNNTGPGIPIPQGAKIVAGNPMNMEPLNTKDLNWTCDERSNRRGPYPDIVTANCAAAGGEVYLTAHVDFPTCWNGNLNGTNDTPNFTYLQGSVCPPEFPIATVELRQTIKWDYRGNGLDVALTSDLMMGAVAGRTLHADFWQTWNQAGFEQFIRECVNTRC